MMLSDPGLSLAEMLDQAYALDLLDAHYIDDDFFRFETGSVAYGGPRDEVEPALHLFLRAYARAQAGVEAAS